MLTVRLSRVLSLMMLAGMMMPMAGWTETITTTTQMQESLTTWGTPNGMTSPTDLKLGNQRVESAKAGQDIFLNGTVVTGNITAGRQVSGTDCQVMGDITAGRDVELRRCSAIHSLTAGRNAQIINTTVHHDVNAGGKVILFNANIKGNVQAAGGVNVENTSIAGTLYVSSPYVRLLNADIQNIHVTTTGGTRTAMMNGTRVTTVSSTQVSTYPNNSGKALISVGANSVSNVNGYTVKGTSDTTTLLAPEGSIYVNGQKVAGPGPERYTDYLASVTNAPQITGPGWAIAPAPMVVTDSSSSNSLISSRNPVLTQGPVVELTNNSIVKGNITFEGGTGRVIVHQGSTFDGNIAGGILEKI